MPNNYLFYKKGELYNYLRQLKDNLKEEIFSLNSDYLLNISVYDLTQHLISKYYLDCPKIDRNEIYIDNQREVDIDVRHDRMRDIRDRTKPFYIKGTEISIAVPFSGNFILFDFQPSSFTSNRPQGIIRGNEIIIAVRQINHNAEEIKGIYNREVGLIERYLSWVESDIKSHNDSLESSINQIIDVRKKKLIADKGLLSDIGLPIKKRDNAPQTYTVPSIIKKPLIKRPEVSGNTYKPEPILANQEYEDILSIIRYNRQIMVAEIAVID